MIRFKYIVKARDERGHAFLETFYCKAEKEKVEAGPQEGVRFMQDVVSSYEEEVLNAAPFCCVACGRAADRLSTAHLQAADPAIFNIPFPYCGSSKCERHCMARSRAKAQNLGQGSRRGGTCSKCNPGAGPCQKHKDLSHLAQVNLTACVICGDTFNLQKCGRCKIVPYCGTDCQKRHWVAHKKVCKATAALAEE